MPETALTTVLPNVITGLLIVGGLSVLTLLILAKLPKSDEAQKDPLRRVMKQFGLDGLPRFVFIIAAILWLSIFGLLTAGLFGLIWEVLSETPPRRDDSTGVWNWRFKLVQLTALTTVLAGVVALPVTLQRLRLSREQNETAKAALFNEKITEAAADLHAQRQVTKEFDRKRETVWEDDIVRRNAAIDRLEGLVREEPNEAARVSRLLSVYVRELSKTYPAKEPPKGEDIDALTGWAHALELQRSDMQNAVQVLGRLARIDGVQAKALEIDLSEANLQAMMLRGANFEKSVFRGASLQGANLISAELQGANLFSAKLQGANFISAKLQGANLQRAKLQEADLMSAELQGAKLQRAKLQGANLIGAKLQGADLMSAKLRGAYLNSAELQGADLMSAELQGAKLFDAELDQKTTLTEANLLAASVRFVDFTNVPQIAPHLEDVFGDGSVALPPGTTPPPRWPKEKLDWDEFHAKWRTFAAAKGIDIPD